MYKRCRLHQQTLLLLMVALATGASIAQKKSRPTIRYSPAREQAVMWHPVEVGDQDLFGGPGGQAFQPNLSKITFIKRETGGHNKKYRIKDGSGRIWVAK